MTKTETTTKIKAQAIEITRAEGLMDECVTVTITSRHGDGDLFRQADAILTQWAQTAPQGGAYDKCDFTVTFENGNTYDGRYDVHYGEGCELAAHIIDFQEFSAGRKRPEHMTEKDYAAMIARNIDGCYEAQDFLADYQIGS